MPRNQASRKMLGRFRRRDLIPKEDAVALVSKNEATEFMAEHFRTFPCPRRQANSRSEGGRGDSPMKLAVFKTNFEASQTGHLIPIRANTFALAALVGPRLHEQGRLLTAPSTAESLIISHAARNKVFDRKRQQRCLRFSSATFHTFIYSEFRRQGADMQ
jgi:hypothetical protein